MTVRPGAGRSALASATVVIEWGYDLYLQFVQLRPVKGGPGGHRNPGNAARLSTGTRGWKLGTGIHTKREKELPCMARLLSSTAHDGLARISAGGLTCLYAGMIAFVVVGALFAVKRMLPARHTS